MGKSTAVDLLIARAREQAFVRGHCDSEDLSDAVVPSRPRELLPDLADLDPREGIVGIPGEWDAVRRWRVLTVAAHLDAEAVEAG